MKQKIKLIKVNNNHQSANWNLHIILMLKVISLIEKTNNHQSANWNLHVISTSTDLSPEPSRMKEETRSHGTCISKLLIDTDDRLSAKQENGESEIYENQHTCVRMDSSTIS